LQSFQRSAKSPAHTFCGACGVHILQAVDPSANELYVNALCLDRDTFVWKSSAATAVPKRDLPYDTKATKGQAEPQQKHVTTTNRSGGSSPNFSSDSDPEMVVVSEQKLDHDPEFTLTAASSAFSDNSSMDNDDALTLTSARSVLSPEKTGGRGDGALSNAIDDGTSQPANAASDMFGSFMNVPGPSTTSDHSDSKPASADQSNLDTSFGSSSTASTTDAQKEQLRKFLGKHVAN